MQLQMALFELLCHYWHLYLCSGKPWLWQEIEGPIQQSDGIGSLQHYHVLNHIIKELQTFIDRCKYCDLCIEYQGCTPLQVFQCSKSTRVPLKYSQCSFEVLSAISSIVCGQIWLMGLVWWCINVVNLL